MNRRKIYSYLVSNGFRIFEQKTSEYFGDYHDILRSSNYELIFNSSKSFESLNIRKTGDKGYGFDFALVRAFMLNESCLNKHSDIDDLELFLKENLEEINELFININYEKTKKNLEELERERVRQMFPKAKSEI